MSVAVRSLVIIVIAAAILSILGHVGKSLCSKWMSSRLVVNISDRNDAKIGLWIEGRGDSIRSIGYYQRGIPDGRFATFHPNGIPRTMGVYKNGMIDGKWFWWSETGELKCVIHANNGKIDSVEHTEHIVADGLTTPFDGLPGSDLLRKAK